jgi:ABC-type sugar transport system permease subunit
VAAPQTRPTAVSIERESIVEDIVEEAAMATATATIGRRRWRGLTLTQRRALEGYMFISLWLFGFLAFLAWPLARSFWLSFHKLEALNLKKLTWIGIDNYKEAFLIDVKFLPNFWRTLTNNALDIPIIMVFSLIVAILANQKVRGQNLFRVIFFLPVVIGSAQVIRELFNQGVGGAALTRESEWVGLIATYFGPEFALNLTLLLNRIILVLWRSGIQILIFLAGLHSISPTLYEAARIDGASDWEVFWKITLPMLSPIVLVNLIFTIVDSFTDPFNQVLEYVRQVAFSGGFRLGYAAALGWLYFFAVFIILAIAIVWASRYVYYGGDR